MVGKTIRQRNSKLHILLDENLPYTCFIPTQVLSEVSKNFMNIRGYALMHRYLNIC